MWHSQKTLDKEITSVFIAAALFLADEVDSKIAAYRLPEGATHHQSIGVPGIGGRGYIYSPASNPDKKCLVSTVGIDTCRHG